MLKENEKIIAVGLNSCFECDGETRIFVVPKNFNLKEEYDKYVNVYEEKVKKVGINKRYMIEFNFANFIKDQNGCREPLNDEIEFFEVE